VSIYNYNSSQVEYAKTNTSSAVSLKSLSELGSTVTNQPKKENCDKLNVREELDLIAKRTRSKTTFH
jgi:hypothetical protein